MSTRCIDKVLARIGSRVAQQSTFWALTPRPCPPRVAATGKRRIVRRGGRTALARGLDVPETGSVHRREHPAQARFAGTHPFRPAWHRDDCVHASSAGRRPCGTKVMRFPMATPSRSYPLGGVGAVTTLPRCSPTRHKAPLSCLIPSSRVAASPSSERRSLRHPVACPSGRETRRRHPARADRFAADGSRFPAQEPSFTAMFAGLAAGTPGAPGAPCFVAGGRRKAQSGSSRVRPEKRPPCTSGRLSCQSPPK